MSHEFDSGMFSQKAAWHRLGVLMPEKIYSTQQAATLGNLDWTVEKVPTYYTHNNEEFLADQLSLIRTDTGKQLGTVSNRYVPCQNIDAFSFFDPFLHEKECYISAAISLSGGKNVCLTVGVEDGIREIVKGDTVEQFMLLVNSHTGKSARLIKLGVNRVVCNNTLQMALMKDAPIRTIPHNKNQEARAAQIQNSINIYRMCFEEEVSIYKQMAARPMSSNDMRSYLERVFANELETAAKNRTDITPEEFKLEDYRFTNQILTALETTPDLQTEGIAGTYWQGFNAITEALKTKTSDLDSRYSSIYLGSDSLLLDRAKQLALIV